MRRGPDPWLAGADSFDSKWHALTLFVFCVTLAVFWAESEDELSDYDSDECDEDEEYDQEELLQHVTDVPAGLVLSAHHVLGAAAGEDEFAVALATARASHVFTAAALAAAAAAAAGGAQPSDTVALAPQEGRGVAAARGLGGGRRSRRRRGRRAAAEEDEDDEDRCGLMLPEELWDAWERLSSGSKGRQYRLLEVRLGGRRRVARRGLGAGSGRRASWGWEWHTVAPQKQDRRLHGGIRCPAAWDSLR